VDPPDADGKYVYVEIEPGKVVAMANVHLPSDPDGMAAVRDGATPAEVLEIERSTRLPKIYPFLAALEPLVSTQRRVYRVGEDVHVRFHHPGDMAIGLSVASAGGDRGLVAEQRAVHGMTAQSADRLNGWMVTP